MVPLVNYVNAAFAWIIVVLSIAAYLYLLKRTGEKMPFLIALALGFLGFAVSHTLTILGVAVAEIFLTVLRVAAYILVIVSVLLVFGKTRRKVVSN